MASGTPNVALSDILCPVASPRLLASGDTFIKDLRPRKVPFAMPTDLLRGPAFTRTLSETYDFGRPLEYPAGVYPDNPFVEAA